jgi:hypothetical protein
MRILKVFVLGIIFLSPCAHADEGMWLLSQLSKSTYKTMSAMGLQLPYNQLYSAKNPSLKDAIVSFGGFCSGVVVSSDGLVFTNHHCGLSSVQQHSSAEHNYLDNGFVAHSLKEELPNPELFVRFLLYTKDVTKNVMKAVKPKMTESQRNIAIDSIRSVIAHQVADKDSTLTADVDAYYGGSEYCLSVYRTFTDVRLVFAPPASVGQFGWDTDNWMWPRHTGDFCVFRIYAGKDNLPADYSPDNVPYHPAYVAPISLSGYQEGDFSMTLGYPGSTERYLSSFGVDEMDKNTRQSMIDVRGVKLAIWKKAMDENQLIHIAYASKYSESSNYWKNSIGMNKAVEKLNILESRRKIESVLQQWIAQHKEEQSHINMLSELAEAYKQRAAVNRAQAYYAESFFNGPELIQFAMQIMNFDFNAGDKQVKAGLEDIVSQYKNYNATLDKKVFKALLKEYECSVDTAFLPDIYKSIKKDYVSADAFIDSLYAKTELKSLKGLQSFLNRDSTYDIMKDPAILLSTDLMVKYLEMGYAVYKPNTIIDKDERELTSALRRMNYEQHYYPDANSTMRMSYGSICSYNPKDGVKYNYFTTAQGILEKARTHQGDHDFLIKPELLKMLESHDFGQYGNKKGSMNVCFISNNDITGGNSGSAMFNEKGELMGLAFDGNWEAMSSDLKYEPNLQRCIGVDIRYVLFLIDKYGKASNIIDELKIVK